MRALLEGEGRPGHREAVLINAAGALVVAGRARDVPAALPVVTRSLDSGAARGALAKLVVVTQGAP
jgi:anthranilate phosphoribosyltransferase